MSAVAAAKGVKLVHLGFCNQTMMPSVYSAANMLVLPSDSETWGLVANEALACGRPIVVSDACGCAPDLAADGMAGRMYPVGDVSALARAIAELAYTSPTAEAIAMKASSYSIKAAADGVIQGIELSRRRVPLQ